VNPAPVAVAELTVTVAVPVDVSVSDCVAAVPTFTLPNDRFDALMLNVDTVAPSCNAKVRATPPALAVSVTVVAVLTVDTLAVKLALVAPDATVTFAGTATSELLLARLTANPPLAAAAFRETVQLSVPAAENDPLVQLRPPNIGTPVPLKLTVLGVPEEELLATVSVPAADPAATGSNCIVSVAV
jgi:hypothetical protein